MRTPIRVLVASGALLGALLATGAPAQANSQIVINQGHADVVGVAYEDGQLNLHVHDGTVEPEVERDPEAVKFQVKPEAETVIPSDPSYAFLGTAGDPVWILPQVQNPDLLWPGIGTEELEAGVFQGDSVKVNFVALAAPGDIAIYTENAFGLPGNILVDSGDGLPDVVTLAAGGHLHANWAFETPGHYWFLVTASGKLAANGKTVSDAAVYHFQVLS
ncbi:surface-anchored protein [Micromonospora pisi]|uniref:Surface-anchored protein n=1 Tax=Micromonospora pisi TaxID=589240 RepID=A0A495JHI7_9ACTN|nr:choice-of-anchor M domain-containing protein [Micromonospora pisi]RKR88357.1 surface-anchored protein [Micromonospora pisi]